jgi:hypothetical protein
MQNKKPGDLQVSSNFKLKPIINPDQFHLLKSRLLIWARKENKSIINAVQIKNPAVKSH